MNKDNINLDDINRITLDLSVPRIVNVRCIQGDSNSRKLIIVLTNDGEFFPVDDSITVEYKLKKPDGKFVDNNVTAIIDGVIYITLSEQAAACAGVVHAELRLSKNLPNESSEDTTSQIISTMPFNIIVEPSVVSNEEIISECESDVINEMITHLKDYNNPHHITKDNIGLGKVENKSSAEIRNEITKSNVTSALGFTPYMPNEIDNKFSALETNIDWKESVPSYKDIASTYPNPQDGWTVNVNDTDYTYRYNGTDWIAISANAIPKATDSVDGLLSKEDHANYNDSNMKKHTHSNKEILDGISSTQISLWNSINNKVDMIQGKGLSTNDYTTAEKNKLASIPAGIVSGIKGNAEGSFRTGNVNITKDNIGLGNVDNTADAIKSVKNADTVDGKHASEFEKSDMFLAYLASNNNGPLCLLSQTVGDTVTTNGRSAINSKGVRSLIFKGYLYGSLANESSNTYGGHVIITTDGTSWEDNDVNDNYGMQPGAGEAFTTPAGNTVYVKTLSGTWAYLRATPVYATLNGKTYTIRTNSFFRYYPPSLKWALELADFYLFTANLSIIDYNYAMPIINGIKSSNTVGTLGYGTNNDYIPNISFLSFWNGKYNDDGSNLAYCNKGAFGDIVTHAASEFLSTKGGTLSGAITVTGRIWGNVTNGYNMSLNSSTGESLILHQKSGNTIWGVGTRQDNSYGWYHWSSGLKMNLTESGDLKVYGSTTLLGNMGIFSDSTTSGIFYIGGVNSQTYGYPHLKITQFSNSLQILPTQANKCTIGHVEVPFECITAKNIYNSSGLITSSDRNKKKDFSNITHKFADVIIDGLKPTSFKYKNGNSGRTHYGLIAQDVEKLLEELEIDNTDFAPLIKEYPKKEVKQEDGSVSLETNYDAEPEYFLRYEGFTGLIIKYIQGLKQENTTLKNKMSQIDEQLELLESKLNMI